MSFTKSRIKLEKELTLGEESRFVSEIQIYIQHAQKFYLSKTISDLVRTLFINFY